jgi:hypothetical protein
MPVRCSATPTATAARLQPNIVAASRALPRQYFSVISACKARLAAPVIFDAARRRSGI